jgi:putative transposase
VELYYAALETVTEWRNRPLEVLFDTLRVKIRDEGFARNKGIVEAPYAGATG